MEKEIRIPIPEGMEIDKENSTFECIKFKPTQKKKWRDNKSAQIEGYFINLASAIEVYAGLNNLSNYSVFATEKQAKSALAMARISQIMANDERFGGVVTDEEWNNSNQTKFVVERGGDEIRKTEWWKHYCFLAFHTEEQRDLFLKENEDLVLDYFMIG